MNEPKHTAEIWTLEDDENYVYIQQGALCVLALDNTDIDRERFKRIIEEHNACAGLTAEEIRDAIALYKEGDWS